MRFAVQRPAFDEFHQTEEELAGALTLSMAALSDGLKAELREQVVRAGLGARLANTWRSATYPKGGASLEPAAYVWSKAPKIIDAYDRGATILPKDGRRYLAIPTANVPLKGRGKRATPVEVEAMFNQDLITRKGRDGRVLAFVNVLQAKNKKGWRRATKGRVAQGRKTRLVLMFVLVPQVTVAKRLDINAVAERWANQLPQLLANNWR